MRRVVQRLWERTDGAVAPIVALSLVGLIAAGGIAFDYARMATMQTELHNAADHAALAAATQLDGQTGAIARAEAAAQSLIANETLFANDGNGTNVGNLSFTFYTGYDQSSDSFGSETSSDAAANVVKVNVAGRTAYFALTPIVGALNSGQIGAEAVASVGHAVCKTPPVMVCNPSESSSNTNENLAYTPTEGAGLKLVTGDATVPGNFGWLQSNNGPGASNLAEQLGYNSVPGDCQPATGVTTKTGMSTSVLNALNTRFDVYANGNQTCPGQDGGTCSPSVVTRKDLVCGTSGSNPTSCKSNASWSQASKPYQLPQSCTGSGKNKVCTSAVADLPTDKSQDPTIMGYPPDECHMTSGAGACGIAGDGKWDRNAFFRVNYGWDASTWQGQTGLSSNATRYQVYLWEMAHPNVAGKGVGVAQKDTGNDYAFGVPATGHPGVSQSTSQADRRVMAIAVLNCHALGVHGHSSDVPVAAWMDVFLVMPVASRAMFSDKNVYVESIGLTTVHTDATAQVVRRDVPYLIR